MASNFACGVSEKINKNEISKINIFYPDNVEQEKIGSLIIKLDHLIAANEQVPKLVIKIVNNSLANSSFSN